LVPPAAKCATVTDGALRAAELRVQKFAGMVRGCAIGMGQGCHQAPSKGVKTPVDFAFGLGRGGDPMSDAQGTQAENSPSRPKSIDGEEPAGKVPPTLK